MGEWGGCLLCTQGTRALGQESGWQEIFHHLISKQFCVLAAFAAQARRTEQTIWMHQVIEYLQIQPPEAFSEQYALP